jgi:phage terminase large subunit-like protein
MLPPAEQRRILSKLNPEALRYNWRLFARPNQIEPPGAWSTWLILAGRGFGKTRCGAEWIREQAESGKVGRIALVAEDAADARDVMVEGDAGIMAVHPKASRPTYEPSKRRLMWRNGCVGTLFSGSDPDCLRGPSHHLSWVDELAKFQYAQATWDNLQMGLRLGAWPRALVTTTPRPTALIKQLVADPKTHLTRGTTFENSANLPEAFLNSILGKYAGTRLGRQELEAEILLDTPGALWRAADIEKTRISPDKVPPMRRIVVAIDPAMATSEGACETGLIVSGVGELDSRGYVLHDASGKYTPDGWARMAVSLFDHYRADRLVAESNLPCGEIVTNTLATVRANLPLKLIHARTGKRARAEPVAALYEQGRVAHAGLYSELEDQLTSWDASTSSESPDRLDALVHALTELMLGDQINTKLFTRQELERAAARPPGKIFVGGWMIRA